MNKNNKLLHLDWGFIDESFDFAIIGKLLEKALKKRKYEIIQYNDGHGLDDLRLLSKNFLTEFFKINNIELENICITNGVTAGLDLVVRFILQNRYDSVYFEPSYDTAINCLKINSRKVHAIKTNPFSPSKPIDNSSWSELELALSNTKTKLLYLIPNFQNPTGGVISYRDRIKIFDLCKKYNVYIIEDDPYKLYNYKSGQLPENFINLDCDKKNVIYLNSVSKIFFPSIRIGFVVANKQIIDGIADIQKYTTSSANLLMQGVVIEAIKSGVIKKSYNHYYSKIKKKRDLIISEFKKQSLDKVIDYTVPTGGFYIWCRLKNNSIDTKLLLTEAKNNNISFVPGTIYFLNNDNINYMRLAYSQIELGDIKEAVNRLKNILNKVTT